MFTSWSFWHTWTWATPPSFISALQFFVFFYSPVWLLCLQSLYRSIHMNNKWNWIIWGQTVVSLHSENRLFCWFHLYLTTVWFNTHIFILKLYFNYMWRLEKSISLLAFCRYCIHLICLWFDKCVSSDYSLLTVSAVWLIQCSKSIDWIWLFNWRKSSDFTC